MLLRSLRDCDAYVSAPSFAAVAFSAMLPSSPFDS
jgi:hypothetical protein